MKKRYAIVGIGGRSRMYYTALATTFKDTNELVGFCDISQTRMDYANSILEKEYDHHKVPTYFYTDFDKMVKETKPDTIIVTTVDRTHDNYIIRAMELGCDVITEKPLTINEEKAQDIIDAQKKYHKNVRVTFNYRYAPHNTKIRELIMDGAIGDVHSVHFEWLLNTIHGADYYRRWHRNKLNSGGLLVHKSTHHFDLVNFWLNTTPKEVFAFGELNFYGRHNAEKRGVTKFYDRCYNNENAIGDHFALNLEETEAMKSMYLDAEKDSGYIRDRSVFDDGISIEDTMGVIVKYNSKAILTYSLVSYQPWEGFIVSINGSKGRIEVNVKEQSYVNAGGKPETEGALVYKKIFVHPMLGEPYEVKFDEGKGGHGGGDEVLLNDLFGTPVEDKFKRAANHVDGAMSILTGIAANKSIATTMPVKIDDLVKF